MDIFGKDSGLLRIIVLFSSPLFPSKLHHGLSRGVAEETAEIGNIVIVHAGGDFLYGEVGFSKIAFEFIDDRVVDEGFGGGLHQAVTDLVQIVGTEAQFGGIKLHAAFMVDMLVQKRVEAVGDAPNGRFLIVNLGRKKLGNPLLNGDEEVVQFAVNHLLADFAVEGSNNPFHPSKPFFGKPLRRLLDAENRMPIKEIPKHRRIEVDGEIGNGGVAHLDKTTRKTRRSAFDGESRKCEKRHQSPTPYGHGPKMRATRAQPSVHNKSVQPLVGTTVWSNPLKSVVPQTVSEVLFGLKNDISNAKVGVFHQKQPILD